MALGIGLEQTLRDALRTFRGAWRRVLVVEILFKLIGTVLAAAGSTAILAWVEFRSGGGAVTNADLVGFLTRPLSILILLLVAAIVASFVLVEQGVLLAVLAGGITKDLSLREQIRAAAAAIGRVSRLGVVCVGALLGVLGVAAALGGAAYKALLSGHDINYYLAAKPPVFFVAAAIGALIGLAAGVILGILFVRWLLALPIAVFEGGARRVILSQSAERARGSGRRIALLFACWHGAIVIVSIALFAVFRPLAARALEGAGGSARGGVVTIVGILALHSLGTALGSFLAAVGHALITLHLYRELHPARPAGGTARSAADAPGDLLARAGAAIGLRAPWMTGGAALGAAVVLLIAVFVVPACVLVSRLGGQDRVEITAHRGASRVAPENTLSAVRAAIDSGADWAEIDVQETSDGRVIVLHDQDLMRLAGDPRRISELTFDEARKLDVGAKFDPKFTGERLPTLEETIDLARGKIRLNIELKYYGKGDPRLAPDVARILRDAQFDRECFVASLDYESLAVARKEWPALKTAAIVTVRVGDPTRLDVDILSMNAKLVNTRFVRAAHRRGKKVLVWTIDDPKLARRLADVGVDDLITNDPAPMVRLRDELAALTRVERMVLGFRVLLGATVDEPAAGATVPEL